MSFIIFPGVITPPLTPGAVPYGTGSTVLMTAQGSVGQVLLSNGAAPPTWANTAPTSADLAGGIAGDLPYQQAPNDTTFLNLTTGGVLYGGASAPAYLANVQGGILIGGATNPQYLPRVQGGILYGAASLPAYSAVGSSGQVLQSNGTSAPTWTTNISGNAANVTGTVAVANGGTGATTLTANNVILGNGANPVAFVAPGTSGNLLTSNGSTWQSAAPPASANWIFEQQTNAVSVTSMTMTFTGTPFMYALLFEDLRMPGSTGSTLDMKFSNLSSSLYAFGTLEDSGGWQGVGSQSTGRIGAGRFNQGLDSRHGHACGIVYIAYSSTAQYNGFWSVCSVYGPSIGAPYQSLNANTYRATGTAATGIEITMNGQAFTGTFTLYRITQ